MKKTTITQKIKIKLAVWQHFSKHGFNSVFVVHLYQFLKELYGLITIENYKSQDKIRFMYNQYIELIEQKERFTKFFKNREIADEFVDQFILVYVKFLLYRESLTPASFIKLNRAELISALEIVSENLFLLSAKKELHGFLTYEQFQEFCSFVRHISITSGFTRYHQKKVLLYDIGKLPKCGKRFIINRRLYEQKMNPKKRPRFKLIVKS